MLPSASAPSFQTNSLDDVDDLNTFASTFARDAELDALESTQSQRTGRVGRPVGRKAAVGEEERRRQQEHTKLLHRANQQQYRDRKKAKAREVEAQHAATAEQLASLRLEHGALSSHQTALQQWQGATEELEGALQAAEPSAPAAPRPCAPAGVFGLDAGDAPLAAQHVDEALLSGLDGLPPATAIMRAGYVDDPADFEHAVRALPAALRAAALGSGDALVAEWRAHALELRECLARIDGGGGCPEVDARLKESMQQMGVAISLAMHRNPQAMRALWRSGTPPRPPLGAGAAEVADWEEGCRALYRRLPEVIDAHPEQRAAALRLWAAFQERCGAAGAMGAAALRRLQELLLEAAHTQGTAAQGAQHLDAGAASEELRGAMREQHAALLSLMHASGYIFSPMQKARASAAMHPFFPDIMRGMQAFAELEYGPIA